MERVLLLVDDERNILSSLARLFRREEYTILQANSGAEALEILNHNKVGVMISDQRMPEMLGVELLSKVKDLYPDTVRIMLSGYTDLQSVTDAINKGAIYKFLTKPWDDDLLKENVKIAFQHYELISENVRLTRELRQANDDLSRMNLQLASDVDIKTHLADINHHALELTQKILECLPLGIVGLGDDDVIALANHKAHELLLPQGGSLIGQSATDVFPKPINVFYQQRKSTNNNLQFNANIELPESKTFVNAFRLKNNNSDHGAIVVMMLKEDDTEKEVKGSF